MSSSDFAVATTVLAVSALCYAYSKSTGQRLPLPPSPKSYPLIGNILVIPARDQYIAYRQWSRELNSDVILIKLPGQSMVVLNSAESVSEFFEKRGKQYFARPSIPLLSDPNLLDWSRHTAFLPYGERWKQQRQLMHSSFRKSGVHIHAEAQTRHSRQAILKIMQQPHEFSDIFQWMLTFQILSCVYGYETTSQDNEMVRLSGSASRNLGKAILPFNFMVNIMPFLNRLPSWFPGMGWKAVARKWNEELRQTIELPYEFTVRQMAEGTATPSAVGEMLKSLQTKPESIDSEDRDRAMWTAGSIFTSAVDSIFCTKLHATLQVMMLAMTLYPEVQSKARREIELITGGKRLPEISDMDQMPYVRCVILEVLRWQPVTPLGLPHTCGEDDEYNGFTIPKNSIVFGNIWAINRDESRYPDPDTFLPERFMDPTVPEPVTFGICPGMYFAHATLFINVVTLLATCDIRPMRDHNGREILPAIQMIQGPLAMTPAPFDCDITVHSEAQRQMLLGVVGHGE